MQFKWGFQGQTQGAGTPHEIAIGGFVPLSVGSNSAFFLDALANVNLTDQRLNSVDDGGTLDTHGIDVGYSITSHLRASVGYYYQTSDLGDANGSDAKARLAYKLPNGLTVGANLSKDQAFNARVSADIKYRFDANGYGAPSIRKQKSW